jgi:hypothetical protein
MSYSAGPCYGYTNRHIAKIDKVIYHIQKNIAQADFENAKERDDAHALADSMVRRLERLKAEISAVSFE